jgi:hypothetical protein
MFIQVISGRVADAAGLRRQLERWEVELQPGATGFLGSTGGVTDDGRFIALARFESAEAARANSNRPEQGAWWAETATCIAGEANFLDCHDAVTLLGGGSDNAGFVQVIQSRATDIERARALMDGAGELIAKFRPDVLGGIAAIADGGTVTEAIYFTSEAEARANEANEPPADIAPLLEQYSALMKDQVYYDLRDPLLA